MPTQKANDIQVYYEEQGAGAPLLLIMGITAPGSVWEPHADCWKESFRCIMPDNRGVGRSDKPAGPYSSSTMADDHAALLRSLGIVSARIVGVSMGSIIAQQLALRHPSLVKSMVLMCPWARADRYAKSVFNHLATIKARLTPQEFTEFIQLLIFRKGAWDDDDMYRTFADARREAAINPAPQPLHGLEAQAAACVEHDALDSLKEIRCPCFVIGGEDDIFTPRWMAEEVAAGIPDCSLHLYPNAGHAFHWERIEDFNSRVREWLLAH